jgi:hypothetical protein
MKALAQRLTPSNNEPVLRAQPMGGHGERAAKALFAACHFFRLNC